MKLQNLVRFPLTGLDMTPHVVKRSQSSWSLPSHWSPWRRPYGLGRDPEDFVYDLYAVCNHHGTMQGGHYTGNPLLARWHLWVLAVQSQNSLGSTCWAGGPGLLKGGRAPPTPLWPLPACKCFRGALPLAPTALQGLALLSVAPSLYLFARVLPAVGFLWGGGRAAQLLAFWGAKLGSVDLL